MQIILFSRNRGCQLELLLRSIKTNFVNWDKNRISILYTYTNEDFEKGYKKTIEIHPEFNYVKEMNFSQDLMKIFNPNEKYTCFGVDDNVFKEKFDLDSVQFNLFVANQDILSLSLRLHPKLTFCYPTNSRVEYPKELGEFNLMKWIGQQGDYGYPMSLDFNIFRTSDIMFYIFNSHMYFNPNSLESMMASRPLPKPHMIFYDKSPVMNLPMNKVQDFNNNLFGDVTAEFLNEKYLSNKRISMSNIQGFQNISCHQEIKILFEDFE